MKKIGLFEAFGVELEYMIVDKESLRVLPITDKILETLAGTITDEVLNGKISWSNELALHVIELKTTSPVPDLAGLDNHFLENIHQINQIAASWGGMLMPTAMHPFMNPEKEMKLWPHGYNEVYAKYDEIFECKGHGWSNLQSVHLNLPFRNDDEFAKLHAAIRAILPLLPALAASSPIQEGKLTGFQDTRLEVYRFNQKRVPEIVGDIIPEPVFSQAEYEEKILQKIYRAVASFDPEGILQEEWLNSRGAIARFHRYAIEIRVLDIQECPLADISILYVIVGVLKLLMNERWVSFDHIRSLSTQHLSLLLLQIIREGEYAIIEDEPLLKAFGLSASCSARAVWNHLLNEVEDIPMVYRNTLTSILHNGTLSTRLKKMMSSDVQLSTIQSVYRKCSDCLQNNQLLTI